MMLTNTARYFPIAPASRTALVDSITLILLNRGWEFISTVTGGNKLKGTSPQGYEVFLSVYTAATDPDRIVLQFSGSVTGYAHWLDFQSGYTYNCICSRCNISLCRPGVASNARGSNVIGGILFSDDGCGVGTEPVTELWYSFGDFGDNPVLVAYSPRWTLDLASILQAGEVCYNGNLISAAISQQGSPRILVQTHASHWENSPPLIEYIDGTPLIYTPLVASGLTASDTTQTRVWGGIYDALIRSIPDNMDLTDVINGFNVMSITNQFSYGTLWLLVDEGISIQKSNYVHGQI